MIVDSSIPVWLKVTCENGCHNSIQVEPQSVYVLNEGGDGFRCPDCGATGFNKVTVDGSANADMRTLEEVRKG